MVPRRPRRVDTSKSVSRRGYTEVSARGWSGARRPVDCRIVRRCNPIINLLFTPCTLKKEISDLCRRSGGLIRASPFGEILISFGVVWYSGMRKWYAGFSVVVAAVGVVPGAKPCKSAGITRVYLGFCRYTPAKYRGILPISPILLATKMHSDSLWFP